MPLDTFIVSRIECAFLFFFVLFLRAFDTGVGQATVS